MNEANQKKNDSDELLQLVGFRIGNEEYGVNILDVHEINKMTHVTKIPNSPDFVEGVINLRGRVIPVIDLRIKLGLERKEHNKDTRIIVVSIGDNVLGFIVDSVNEVLRVPVSFFETPPEIVAGAGSEFINSVGKLEDRLLTLIDLNKILLKEETLKLQEAI